MPVDVYFAFSDSLFHYVHANIFTCFTLINMFFFYGWQILGASPLELCDRVANNGDANSHSYPIQPVQGSGLGPSLMPGSAMRPPSAGLPSVLPGSAGLHLGQSPVSSSAAMSAAAAR